MAAITDGELLAELSERRKMKGLGVEERRENRRAIEAIRAELARRAQLRKERINNAPAPQGKSIGSAIYEEEKSRGWSTE